jgi:hypothetical protein
MTSLTSPTYRYPYPYPAVFEAVVAVLPTIEMVTTGTDHATGSITAKTPMSFYKWGETITISLWEASPGFTGFSATSALKFGFMDPFGFNRGNLDRLVLALGANLEHHLAHLRTPEPAGPT